MLGNTYKFGKIFTDSRVMYSIEDVLLVSRT